MKTSNGIALAAIVVLGISAPRAMALGGASTTQSASHRSEFVSVPNANPFFPRKLVEPVQDPGPVQITADLFNVSIVALGDAVESCTINHKDLKLGQQMEVPTKAGNILIKCAGINKKHVTIALTNGVRLKLTSPQLRDVLRFTP